MGCASYVRGARRNRVDPHGGEIEDADSRRVHTLGLNRFPSIVPVFEVGSRQRHARLPGKAGGQHMVSTWSAHGQHMVNRLVPVFEVGSTQRHARLPGKAR